MRTRGFSRTRVFFSLLALVACALAAHAQDVQLTNGVPASGTMTNTSQYGGWKFYTIAVPSGASQLRVTLTGLCADADLYARLGSHPDLKTFTGRSAQPGITNESWTMASPGSGTWYFGVINATPGRADYTITATVNMGPSPPPVPSGAEGYTPMKATKQNAAATTVQVTWDPAHCTSTSYNLLYGAGSAIGSYTLSGSACPLGTTGSYTWTSAPDPSADASKFLWWVIVGGDGLSTEGSWGKNSAGAERHGAAPSGQCSCTVKNTNTTCP